MSETKKSTRTKTTMTTMILAITEMYFATASDDDTEEEVACEIVLDMTFTGKYRAILVKKIPGGDATENEVVCDKFSMSNFEEAVALILEDVAATYEKRRAETMAELNAVADKYKGVLRSARGKFRGKKEE